jgi:hypothetical protein
MMIFQVFFRLGPSFSFHDISGISTTQVHFTMTWWYSSELLSRPMKTGFNVAAKTVGNDRKEIHKYPVNISTGERCERGSVGLIRNYVAQIIGLMLFMLVPAVAMAEPGGESYQSVAGVLGSMDRYNVPKTMRRRNSNGEVYVWGVTEHSADDFTRMTGWRISNSLHVGYQQGLDSGLSLLWQGERDQMSVSGDGIRFTRRF